MHVRDARLKWPGEEHHPLARRRPARPQASEQGVRFGSVILERAIDTRDQPAVFNYAPDGLTYDLEIAIASICAPPWLSSRQRSIANVLARSSVALKQSRGRPD